MLNAYIKTTGGTMRWITFGVLSFIQPIMTLVFLLMIIGGIVTFVLSGAFYLMAADNGVTADPRHRMDALRFMFFLSGVIGIIGTLGRTFYDTMLFKMYTARFFTDEEEAQESAGIGKKAMDALSVIGIYAGFCAVTSLLHKSALPVGVWRTMSTIGIATFWFFTVGMVLGMVRGIATNDEKAAQLVGGVRERIAVFFRRRRGAHLKLVTPAPVDMTQAAETKNETASVVTLDFGRRAEV